jgi:hypothetical protein
MSFDESFLAELLEALSGSGLDVVLIGNAAAILHGVPVMTQDVDLMVRDHRRLEEKLKQFAKAFGSPGLMNQHRRLFELPVAR